MSEFCLWTLALGTAPLVLGALWDQLVRLNRSFELLHGHTGGFVPSEIMTAQRSSSTTTVSLRARGR
jgi:hypothetical protein